MAARKNFDIVIVGGGLVGASLAMALAGSRFIIAVIEPFAVDADEQPSYDERTIALTYSAKHIFNQIGVWDESLEAEACALKSIHISNQGHFGITHLSHTDVGTEALGYVIPARALGKTLIQQLSKAKNIRFFCPYEAKEVRTLDDKAEIDIQAPGSDEPSTLTAKLIVIADGGRSPLLENLGFVRQSKDYTQSALLSIVSSNVPHQHKAYERFVKNGPLALLPMTKQRFAVVWTLSPDELSRISALSDTDFIFELQSVFGTRAGLLSKPTPRKAYPLSKSELKTPYSDRVLALGNAAHTVHPVAGQGFNLGLRDVAALAEQLLLDEAGQDIGAIDFLKSYSQNRARDTQRVGQFTDGLLNIFSHPSPLIQLGRNIGLAAIENLPFVKRALLKRTMGMGKNQPRLARGLKIR